MPNNKTVTSTHPHLTSELKLSLGLTTCLLLLVLFLCLPTREGLGVQILYITVLPFFSFQFTIHVYICK